MLSIRIRDWCVPWAYGSGTDAFAEHTHQELMRMLSVHCTHQFLTRMLRISVKIPNFKGAFNPCWEGIQFYIYPQSTELTRGPPELVSIFVYRGSSHRRQSAVCPKFDRDWLHRSPVLRNRDVYPGSGILIVTHPGSRISDPGSKNSYKREGWKEICCHTFICRHKFHKM